MNEDTIYIRPIIESGGQQNHFGAAKISVAENEQGKWSFKIDESLEKKFPDFSEAVKTGFYEQLASNENKFENVDVFIKEFEVHPKDSTELAFRRVGAAIYGRILKNNS